MMTDQAFTPEPCEPCDTGQPCEIHAPSPTWADSWLHPSERKRAPRIERN